MEICQNNHLRQNVMLPPFWPRVDDKCRHTLAAVIPVKSMNMIQRVMQGSLFLTWISFNLSMDKLFHPSLYTACNYLSMELK